MQVIFCFVLCLSTTAYFFASSPGQLVIIQKGEPRGIRQKIFKQRIDTLMEHRNHFSLSGITKKAILRGLCSIIDLWRQNSCSHRHYGSYSSSSSYYLSFVNCKCIVKIQL